MPWSDEERLERVYRRAASIRLVRRARVMAAVLPLLVLAGAVVASAASTDDGRKLEVAGPSTTVDSTTTTLPNVGTLVPTVPPTVSIPPTTATSIPKLPPATTPTTAPRPPDAENCGGYVRGDHQPPQPPEGMRLTAEVSKQTVRRGEEVVLTLRAKWSGTDPYTYSRRGAGHLVFVHLNGPIFYSSQYEAEKPPTSGDVTFQPGEEKTYSVRWKTTQSCGPNGMRDGWLKTGTYTVEGLWDDFWAAETVQFELVD